MSYYNPDIYNYEALKPEDKKLLDVYDMAVRDAANKDFIIEDMMGLHSQETKTLLGRIKREVAEEVFEKIVEYLAMQRMELIVGIVDNYPEEE